MFHFLVFYFQDNPVFEWGGRCACDEVRIGFCIINDVHSLRSVFLNIMKTLKLLNIFTFDHFKSFSSFLCQVCLDFRTELSVLLELVRNQDKISRYFSYEVLNLYDDKHAPPYDQHDYFLPTLSDYVRAGLES